MKFIDDLDEQDKKEEGSRLERAKAADLVTLPENVEGTNCGNCQFVDLKTKFCNHEKVLQTVSPRMCCIFWNAPGTKREWVKEEGEKTNDEE
jgi:hypothetical protein